MVKKYCPKCKSYSYSANEEGKWMCPICRNDLTHEEILILEKSDLGGEEDNKR